MLDERDIQIIREIIQESEARLEARLDARMESRIAESEARIEARFKEMGERIDEMGERVDGMGKRIDEMGERIEATESRIIAYIESDILPKFDILAEGHQVLRETLAPNTRVEKVEEEVAFIKPLVLSNTRDIVELKKAQ